MLSPIATLGFILATLFGAAFHLILGGDARRLALFLLCGWLGFALGHLVGTTLQINIFNIGTLRVAAAAAGAITAILVAHFLTAKPKQKRPSG
ncbi:MAG: hypothetical protein HXY41_12460 [Chloroflexi bacterium]|nr:hypothetical protein [Chloroflexota bacterium]